jgi:5-methyltetrahydropteroyltriglutamate--homocysteine methyltransferase
MTTIYRAEIIGSLLRPDYLKEARRAWEADQLSTLEFKRSEDRAVNAALALQEEAGLGIVTDGEMRRALFTGTLTEAIEGISPTPGQSWHWFGQTPADEMDFQPAISPARFGAGARWQPRNSPTRAARRINR